MTDVRTAQIIPFPDRRPEPPKSDRLTVAMGTLSVALKEQQLAVARWRKAIDDLNTGMRALNAGVKELMPNAPHAS